MIFRKTILASMLYYSEMPSLPLCYSLQKGYPSFYYMLFRKVNVASLPCFSERLSQPLCFSKGYLSLSSMLFKRLSQPLFYAFQKGYPSLYSMLFFKKLSQPQCFSERLAYPLFYAIQKHRCGVFLPHLLPHFYKLLSNLAKLCTQLVMGIVKCIVMQNACRFQRLAFQTAIRLLSQMVINDCTVLCKATLNYI